ncbi:MAG: hypothetical protein AAEJ04_00470, partial [Planctomycetota bacterium]
DGPTAANGGENLADAAVIGPGSHGVDTSASSTDGVELDPAVCDPGDFGSDQLHNDIWYSFTAAANGEVEVSTCDLVSFDSRIAIYLGANGDPANAVACNDDGTGCSGFTSYLTFQAAAGQLYTVRVGGFSSGDSGTGTMSVTWLSSDVSPLSSDCDSDGTPDECQADTDNDGTIDPCDDDLDGDGIPNTCDVDQTGGTDCDSDGTDDSCETDTDSDGTIDDCDNDDDGDGIPDVCDTDTTGGADCDVDGQDDSCQTDTDSDGTIDPCDDDLDGDGIPNACDFDQAQKGDTDCDLDGQTDSCQDDTDSDGTIDPCDPDLDGDGIDNDCDIDQTAGADCNENGTLDSCDISAGEADNNTNGVPDACEETFFIRGNANNDSSVDLGDGILILGYLFVNDTIPCLSSADTTDDGQIDITDAIFIFTYQFVGGAAPSAPFPDCGGDPTPDTLECLSSSCP